VCALFSSCSVLSMTWLSGAGESLTYRDFWAASLAVYTGLVSLCALISCIVLWMYGRRYWFMEPSKRTWRDDIPIYGVCGMYLVSQILLLAQTLPNGIVVFGGSSLWWFIRIQIVLHVFFILVKMMLGSTRWTLTSFSIVSGVAIFGSIQTLSMFDYVDPNITWLIGITASTPTALAAIIRFIDHDESLRYAGSLKSQFVMAFSRKRLVVLILGVYFGGILTTYFSAGTCLIVYGNKASGSWIHWSPSAQWSSRWMRSASINPCPPDGTDPCHVYLTAGSNLTSEVFVNVHLPLHTKGSSLVVYLGHAEVVAEEYQVPLLDDHLQRRFFVAHLTGLKAENSFSLRIGFRTVGEEAYWFRMVPGDGSPVSMVIAGDSGITETADKIMAQMIRSRPHVVFIGGDVAYDNGLLSCSCVWDDFLHMWEKRRVDGKYLVPLSFAVGNHDVGVTDNFSAFDTLSESKCDPTSRVHGRPMFFDWFPHEVDEHGRVLPSCQRTTIRKHSIGDKVNVWMLDTAYAVSTEDNVKFVDANMGSKPVATNLAIYHVPMYAANLDDLGDGPYLRDVWPSKIFDKYSFKACFENHAHAYKRTKRLINNTVATNGGTVYIGDGRMGITDALERHRMIPPDSENVFAHTDVEYHFLSISIGRTGDIKINAVNEQGVVFDSQEL